MCRIATCYELVDRLFSMERLGVEGNISGPGALRDSIKSRDAFGQLSIKGLNLSGLRHSSDR